MIKILMVKYVFILYKNVQMVKKIQENLLKEN